jgi:hypothetical protein
MFHLMGITETIKIFPDHLRVTRSAIPGLVVETREWHEVTLFRYFRGGEPQRPLSVPQLTHSDCGSVISKNHSSVYLGVTRMLNVPMVSAIADRNPMLVSWTQI